jgi:glycosyltransferase involved in cell wall biosynthesis
MLRVMQVLHQGGGAGSVTSTLHLSLGLSRSGVQVRFACPPNSEVEVLARNGGLEVLPVSLEPSHRRVNAAKLLGILQRHPVDLINSQSSRDRTALTWLAVRGRLSIPLVVTRRQMPRTMFLENWLVSRMAARVIAVSRSVADALVRRGTTRKKLVVIPNGLIESRVDEPVASQEVEDWRARIGWDPERRTIGIVSRLKDQEIAIRALEHVSVPTRLVLAGVGPTPHLQRLVSRIPAQHAVVLVPFTSAVRPLYELLELVLLPSRIEGLSQALLEAMALGKPVIASAAAGNRDLITNGVNGILVDPLEPTAWARAVEHLLTDEALGRRLGEAARRTARHTYTLEHTIQRTSELYRSIVESRSLVGTR